MRFHTHVTAAVVRLALIGQCPKDSVSWALIGCICNCLEVIWSFVTGAVIFIEKPRESWGFPLQNDTPYDLSIIEGVSQMPASSEVV